MFAIGDSFAKIDLSIKFTRTVGWDVRVDHYETFLSIVLGCHTDVSGALIFHRTAVKC
jgi:hypothetical protein